MAAPVAEVRPGQPGDEFAGLLPASVARPSSVPALAALVASAAADGARIAVRGAGTKADWAPPPLALDLLVETGGLAEVLEYDPGDLVVRAQAGCPLEALQAVLGEAGQWLGLDPPEPGATLGGIVAADASGPRRQRYGTVRDLLIGATFVRADGTVARTGGKVVKNVAGYDLGKLLTGSWGTLGVLAEVTFRLHPRPAAAAVVTTPAASSAEAAALLARLHGSRLEPAAVELDGHLDAGRPVRPHTLALLFEGLPAAVSAQAEAAAALLGGTASDDLPEWWGGRPWGRSDLGLRLAYAPGSLQAALDALAAAFPARVHVRGRAAVGVLEAGVEPRGPVADGLSALRAALGRLDGTAVVTALPPGAPALDRWGPVRGLDQMRAVKDSFDPGHLLAPGRFVGGI